MGFLKMNDKDNKIPLEEKIYREIKSAILNGKIGPKTQLGEEQLAEAFNVSRTPIRHVLKLLKHEKIVEVIPKKGIFIYEPTFKEVLEAFQIRKALELEAVRVASLNPNKEKIKEIEELTYLEERYYEKFDYEKGNSITTSVHLEIAKLSGNDMLYDYCKEIGEKISIYLGFYDHQRENFPCAHEHRQILKAIKEGNSEEAQSLMELHTQRVIEDLKFHKNETVNIKEIFKPIK